MLSPDEDKEIAAMRHHNVAGGPAANDGIDCAVDMAEVCASTAKGKLPSAGESEVVSRLAAILHGVLVLVGGQIIVVMGVILLVVVVAHHEREPFRHGPLGFQSKAIVMVTSARPA